MKKRKREKPMVLCVLGTRPEAIKMAPILFELKRSAKLQGFTCFTGQHKEMVNQVCSILGITADVNLGIMRKAQSLEHVTARAVVGIKDLIVSLGRPAMIVVQGDTTTACIVALVAFYNKIPVAHVEAGLRTYDRYVPFPEELNRIIISHIAQYNFAPTHEAKENLLTDGVSEGYIFVTGNTGIDALDIIRKRLRKSYPHLPRLDPERKLILVTAHRRESFGGPLQRICGALRDLAEMRPDVEIVYPVHLNPNVRGPVRRLLRGLENVHLIAPVNYEELVYLMSRSYLILTDSGGIQEEAPTFRKPLLVLREVTERPEGVKMGVARLVGTGRERLVKETLRLLDSPGAYRSMMAEYNPYGDGKAAKRIVRILERKLTGPE